MLSFVFEETCYASNWPFDSRISHESHLNNLQMSHLFSNYVQSQHSFSVISIQSSWQVMCNFHSCIQHSYSGGVSSKLSLTMWLTITLFISTWPSWLLGYPRQASCPFFPSKASCWRDCGTGGCKLCGHDPKWEGLWQQPEPGLSLWHPSGSWAGHIPLPSVIQLLP